MSSVQRNSLEASLNFESYPRPSYLTPVQFLARHPRCVFSSAIAHPSPHRVYPSASTRPSPLPWLFECNRSLVTPTVSIRAPALARHSCHVFLSATARVSPPLCLFERNRSPVAPRPPGLSECNHSCIPCAISIRAPALARWPHRVYSSATACLTHATRMHIALSPRPVTGTCMCSPYESEHRIHIFVALMYWTLYLLNNTTMKIRMRAMG